MQVLGIDIGGSGIKGAPVDIETGELTAERYRVKTPEPATPEGVTAGLTEVVQSFNWSGPVGVGFPGVVKQGKVFTAANLDKSWIGVDAEKMFSEACGCPVAVLNDADAAGLGEARFGGGGGHPGVIILVTIGTGLGTAVIANGHIVQNTELGHAYNDKGIDWELVASEAAKKREDLSWTDWGKRFSDYLNDLCLLMYPDLIILGGGASKKYHKFEKQLKVGVEVVPAELLNMAGIIGAALFASERFADALTAG